jgi:hypothetical protein
MKAQFVQWKSEEKSRWETLSFQRALAALDTRNPKNYHHIGLPGGFNCTVDTFNGLIDAVLT